MKFKDKDDLIDNADHSHTEIGLNLGMGLSFDIEGVLPFAELKYVAGDADQAVLLLGVKFNIGE